MQNNNVLWNPVSWDGGRLFKCVSAANLVPFFHYFLSWQLTFQSFWTLWPLFNKSRHILLLHIQTTTNQWLEDWKVKLKANTSLELNDLEIKAKVTLPLVYHVFFPLFTYFQNYYFIIQVTHWIFSPNRGYIPGFWTQLIFKFYFWNSLGSNWVWRNPRQIFPFLSLKARGLEKGSPGPNWATPCLPGKGCTPRW